MGVPPSDELALRLGSVSVAILRYLERVAEPKVREAAGHRALHRYLEREGLNRAYHEGRVTMKTLPAGRTVLV